MLLRIRSGSGSAERSLEMGPCPRSKRVFVEIVPGQSVVGLDKVLRGAYLVAWDVRSG